MHMWRFVNELQTDGLWHSALSFACPRDHRHVVGILQFTSLDMNQPSLPTRFVFLKLFYGRSDLSLSATFHWPFSRDGQLVAIISYANDLSRFLSHFLTV